MRFFFSSLVLLVVLSACSFFSQDELSGRIAQESFPEESSQTYEGEIQALESMSLASRATHKLVLENGEELLLRSPQTSLDSFLGVEVILNGKMTSTPSGIEVLAISSIEKKESVTKPEQERIWKSYTDKSSRFTFSYPEDWQIFWAQKVTLLKKADDTVVKITRFDNANNLSLSEFVKESFEEVTVNGKVALKVSQIKGMDLYFAANGEIIKISFSGEEEALEEDFYNFLNSIVFSEYQQTLYCGGAENILCPQGFRCEITGGNTGVCVSFSETSSQNIENRKTEFGIDSEFLPVNTEEKSQNGLLYENVILSFHLYYPQSWWWKSFGPQEKSSLWHIEFSEKEIENVGDGSIMVDVKHGGSGKVEEMKDGMLHILIPRDESTHFEVSGNTGMESFIRTIANSIQSTY